MASGNVYMTDRELKYIYNLPWYYYEVRVDDKVISGSVDRKQVEKVYNETKSGYVELVRLNHGNFDKVIKEKDL